MYRCGPSKAVQGDIGKEIWTLGNGSSVSVPLLIRKMTQGWFPSFYISAILEASPDLILRTVLGNKLVSKRERPSGMS